MPAFFAEMLFAKTDVLQRILILGVATLVFGVVVTLLARRWKRYQAHLSRRYLLSRFSALAAFLAITFGVAVILIVLSIMGGYIETLRDTLRGQESHLIVDSPRLYELTNVDRVETLIKGVPNIKATAPFLRALAAYRSASFNPCQLRGIDPSKHLEVTGFGRYTLRPAELKRVLEAFEARPADPIPNDSGAARRARTDAIKLVDTALDAPNRVPMTTEEFAALFSLDYRRQLLTEENPRMVSVFEHTAPPSSVLVGSQLLLEREVFLGQVLNFVTTEPGSSTPVSFRLIVAGAFKTGTFQADTGLFYMDDRVLRNKLNLYDPETYFARYEGIQVTVDDLEKLNETASDLRKQLAAEFPRLRISTWEQLKRTTIMAVEIERYVIYFLLVLLVAFTACMILLMLLLTVIEKTRDIGVLLALGATPRGVVGIFLINGLTLTVVGTLAGLLSGYIFCSYINTIHDWVYTTTGVHLFPPDVYDLDRIPIAFQFGDVLLSVAPALVLGFTASLIPALWASRRDPIKAIHHE